MLRTPRAARWLGLLVLFVVLLPSPAANDDVAKAIATIQAVGREGTGNDAAAAAWKALVTKGKPALFPVLEAVDDARPTAANWLRNAAGAIADNERQAGRALPAAELSAFVSNSKFAPSARRLAFDMLNDNHPAAAAKLLPTLLDDPSPDLRRAAVAAEFEKVGKQAGPAAEPQLRKLLGHARDRDQVEAVAQKLEADYKAKVNIPEHFAFVTHWQLVGPFDSEEGKALTLAYPPEKATNTLGRFPGKGGTEVAWKPHATADKFGIVDLNKALGKHKNAAAYALAVIVAEKETPCEVRVGCIDALQIFLNGAKLFEREEYHHGMPMDHHVGKGTLKAGENVLVLKVCQNNQTETWAQDWMFQCRVCDATGGPLPGVTQLVGDAKIKLGTTPAAEEKK